MINLREFRRKPDRLSDYLLWAGMIRPGVILNKDGSLQGTFRYRGPDLDSATPQELMVVTAKINNALKRLSGGWAIYAESQRIKSKQYATAEFPDIITYLIEEERQQYFSQGNHYESMYYFTLVYLPEEDNQDKMKKFLIEGDDKKASTSGEEHLKHFIDEADKVLNLFAEILPEAEPLSEEETLTYLHSCISPKQHTVKPPEIPMYLDAYLADTPLLGGMRPRLGNHHLRVISILSFPGASMPGIFDNLNRLNFEYRWVTRFICLDKREAENETGRYQRLHYAKRKSMATLIKEMLTQSETAQVNEDAVAKAEDSAAAGFEVANDLVAYGYYTTCIVLLDEDEKQIDKKAKAVEKTINSLGFTATIETLNCVESWFGSLPGMCYSNLRRPLLSTLNLSHMLPISAIWAGPEKNGHLNGPPLLYTETSGNTPFRMDIHVEDLGHSMVIGPPGAGKSVLLSMLGAAFRKYKNDQGEAQIYIFDKGGSSRALTAGVGGNFYDLGAELQGALSFQPLAQIDDEHERAWAAEWVYEFLRAENLTITPEHKQAIWNSLCSLATAPVHQRNITGLRLLLTAESPELGQALGPLTVDGAFGRLFDAQEDTFGTGRWQVFEMETIMRTPIAVAPTLSYLFHRLEQRLTGAPTLIILDECWMFLDNPVFAAKIREWLKVLRKQNTAVVFATQSLQDVANSPIAPAILDSCPTRIFLPNSNAIDERMAKVYEMFGLNSREINTVATATPKRHYYYKSALGSRLFELALGKVALAYTAASSKEEQIMVQKILAEKGKSGFNEAWFAYKNLSDKMQFFE